jgi:N-acetylglucosaminyldiphosphoundecaprenol N-acetyl-beta-D-mannosaminyltransferase
VDSLVIDLGKRDLLGVLVDAVDYEAAVDRIVSAAMERRSYAASALAVHGVMTGVDDDEHRHRLNHLDLITPDGQPVRWALNLLHRTKLPDRVYGPKLTLEICESAAQRGLPVFFYGSRPDVLSSLTETLQCRFPDLIVAGTEASKFRTTTLREKADIAKRIRDSGARIAFVGLGCPRQEVFVFEYREDLPMPLVAVGAAFEYHAGLLDEAPPWMQRWGLQWIHRLGQDPKRLWRRYLMLNPRYLAGVTRAAIRPSSRPIPDHPPTPIRHG